MFKNMLKESGKRQLCLHCKYIKESEEYKCLWVINGNMSI